MARRVVAQASFSWTCGPIHLLAPYETAASLPPVRARRAGRARTARPYGVAATPLHIATASGWHPQSGTTPLRAKRVLKGKRVIDKREKTAGCLPLARSAAAQAAVIDKREKTAGCLPLARSAAAQAAFPPAMRGQFRNAFQGDTPAAPRRCSHLAGPLRQRLTALPPPLKGEAGWVVQTASVVTRTREILRFAQDDKGRGCRMGGAAGVGGSAHARDSSLHSVPLRMTE